MVEPRSQLRTRRCRSARRESGLATNVLILSRTRRVRVEGRGDPWVEPRGPSFDTSALRPAQDEAVRKRKTGERACHPRPHPEPDPEGSCRRRGDPSVEPRGPSFDTSALRPAQDEAVPKRKMGERACHQRPHPEPDPEGPCRRRGDPSVEPRGPSFDTSALRPAQDEAVPKRKTGERACHQRPHPEPDPEGPCRRRGDPSVGPRGPSFDTSALRPAQDEAVPKRKMGERAYHQRPHPEPDPEGPCRRRGDPSVAAARACARSRASATRAATPCVFGSRCGTTSPTA